MAYFVVERGSGGGPLRIPLPEAFETREAAIAALSAATASGEVTLDGEVFIADLGSAVPVLVMQAAQPVQQAEAPAEAAGTEETWDATESLEDEGATLADALKRAASSLEDEGIIAPESIASEPEAAVEVGSEEAGDDALSDGVEPSGEVAEPASVTEPSESGLTSWPWANVEAYLAGSDDEAGEEAAGGEADEADEVKPDSAEPDEEPDAIAELEAEFGSLITSAPPEGEDAYLPQPVILGDYGEDSAPSVEAIPTTEPATEDEDEPGAPEETTTSSEALPEAVYEPAGDLDMAEYTCQDCVYANTCPKVGQTTPAECGSFQWKSI